MSSSSPVLSDGSFSSNTKVNLNLLKWSSLDVTLALSLFLSIYLTFASENFFEFLVLSKLLLVALVWPTFRRSAYLWFLVAAVWIPTLVVHWCNHEDHTYFGFYWCCALAVALVGQKSLASKPGTSPAEPEGMETSVRKSARLLIGLCFLFAVAWKILAPDFRDASLFHYKLLLDDRFSESVTRFGGGMEVGAITSNVEQLYRLREPGADIESISVQFNWRTSLIAQVMTWWTIAIEGFLAIAFLWPSGRRINFIKNTALMVFCLSVYCIAPVLGFGMAFLIMGYANCEANERRTKIAYLSTFVLLLGIVYFRSSLFPSDIRDWKDSLDANGPSISAFQTLDSTSPYEAVIFCL